MHCIMTLHQLNIPNSSILGIVIQLPCASLPSAFCSHISSGTEQSSLFACDDSDYCSANPAGLVKLRSEVDLQAGSACRGEL